MSSTSTTWTTDTNTKSGTVQVYSNDISVLRITAGEGEDAILDLFADQGDDNADKWRMWVNSADDDLHFSNYTSGTAWTDILTIQDGGNVGIGTASPSHKLSVVSAEGGYSAASFYNTHTTNGYGVFISAGDDSSVYSLHVTDKDENSLLKVRSDGNVGIGTASPSSTLHIVEDNTNAVPLRIGNMPASGGNSNNDTTSIYWAHMDSDDDGKYNPVAVGTKITDASARKADFFIAVADLDNVDLDNDIRFLIDETGKVGIGTTAPAALLHLKSSLATTVGGLLIESTESTDTDAAPEITLWRHADTDDYEEGATQGALGIIRFRGVNESDADVDFASIEGQILDSSTNEDGMILFNAWYNDANATRMCISGRNVGIGTTSPDQLLEISADVSAQLLVTTYNNGATTNSHLILRTADGTEASEAATDSGDVLGDLDFQGNDGDSFEMGARIRAMADENWSGSALGTNLTFHTVDNATTGLDERMRIDHNGNVGIGTAAPATNLEVSSTASATCTVFIDAANGQNASLQLGANEDAEWKLINDTAGHASGGANVLQLINDGTDEVLTILQDGKVGIGNSVPTSTLHVEASAGAEVSICRGDSGGSGGFEVVDDNVIGTLSFKGYDDTFSAGAVSGVGTGAKIVARANSDWNNSNALYAPADLEFYTQTSGTGDGMSSPRMVIDKVGKVGIGTATPDAILHIVGVHDDDGIATQLKVSDSDDITQYCSMGYENALDAGVIAAADNDTGWKPVLINPIGGKVGIGTTTPAKALHVVNSALVKGRPTFTLSGSIDVTGTNVNVPGTSTKYLTELSIGDDIVVSGETRTIASITNDTTATVTSAWGSNLANDASPDCNPAAFTVIRDNGNIGMVLDDDGNVGIGTTAPGRQLEIVNTTTHSVSQGGTLRLSANDGTVMVDTDQLGRIEFAGAEDTSNTISPGASIRSLATETWAGTDNGAKMIFAVCIDGGTGPDDAMTIEHNGNVGIGTTDPVYPLDVVASPSSNYAARIFSDGGASTDYGLIIQAGADTPGTDGDCRWIALAEGDAGTVHAHIRYKHTGTTAEIHAVSDERLKENIQNTSVNGLDAINSLQFREYNWTENSKRSQNKINIGLVAQEVTTAGDKCNIVSKFEDEITLKDDSKITDVQGIGYDGILLYLAKAVQELSAKVEALENA